MNSPKYVLPAVFFILGRLLVASCEQSRGCKSIHRADFPIDKIVRRTISVNDPRFEKPVEREYLIRIPGGDSSSSPLKKLLLYFHGFQGNASDVSWKYEYNMMGRLNNMITVFPEGMSDLKLDGQLQGGYQSWNAQGSSSPTQKNCSGPLDNCYESCKKLEIECGPCAFATCHNDTLFVSTLLDYLLDTLCIATDQVFATGLSNGGFMTYELASKSPERFRAFAVVYGLPMQGSLNFSNPAIRGRSLLHIHGKNDIWVPHDGRPNLHGWLMESAENTVTEYAKIQGCHIHSPRTSWPTPYDTVRNLSCTQFTGCESADVVLCMFEGQHFYPPMVEELTWLFFQHQIDCASIILMNVIRHCALIGASYLLL